MHAYGEPMSQWGGVCAVCSAVGLCFKLLIVPKRPCLPQPTYSDGRMKNVYLSGQQLAL
jgi:hypothetical protein